MHELSIALNILDIAAEESARRGAVAVHAIHLRLGPLSGIVKDALVSAFELAKESSQFPHVRLIVEETRLIGFCSRCESEQPVISIQQMGCSCCGSPISQIVRGREMEIFALEIEDSAGHDRSRKFQNEDSK